MVIDIKKYFSFLFILLLGVVFVGKVNAQTYSPTSDLFENSQTNNLLSLANNYIDNFYSKKFVIFQIDNNYYLVSSSDVVVQDDYFKFNNASIVYILRNNSGYSSYYSYYFSNESETIVNKNYIVISNIYSDKTSSSTKFEEYQFRKYLCNIGIFILGLIFAIFLTKERRY